jgi:hypothetical protein
MISKQCIRESVYMLPGRGSDLTSSSTGGIALLAKATATGTPIDEETLGVGTRADVVLRHQGRR